MSTDGGGGSAGIDRNRNRDPGGYGDGDDVGVDGSCLCGAVRYRTTGQSLGPVWFCHCEHCRKTSGTAFATWLACDSEGFEWQAGEALVSQYRTSTGLQRAFCSVCRCILPAEQVARRRIWLPLGGLNLDAPGVAALRPELHTFVGSKAPWFEIADPLLCYARSRDEAGGEALGSESRRAAAAPAPDDLPEALEGSCLCGATSYRMSGVLDRMRSCQCSRCRRSTGSGFFVGIRGAPKHFVLQGDERYITTWTLPGTRFFVVRFCSTCGCLVPGLPGEGYTVLSAGTLDKDPGLRLRCHIHWASKAAWIELSDGLPRFDAFPPDSFPS